MNKIKMTRQELYNQIWSEPMQHVAKKYGLSDVGLGKICRSHNIPRPPSGYWAKVQSGKKTRAPVLPDTEDDGEITINVADIDQIRDPEALAHLVKAEIGDSIKNSPVSVAVSLRGAHPLVSRARTELEGAMLDQDGLIIPAADAALFVKVSKPLVRRALLIMDALLKFFAEGGYEITAGPTVNILGTKVAFGINEALDSKQEQPREHSLRGRYEFGHSKFETKYFPSGRLVLRIKDENARWASGCRKYWRDSDTTPLENRLGKFLSGLIDFAGRKTIYELSQAEEEKRKLEEERMREERAQARAEMIQQKAEEQEKVDLLMQEAEDWRRSQDLLCYIRARKDMRAAREEGVEKDSEFAMWAKWAEAQASRLNPLTSSPPSILDEPIPEEEKPHRYHW